MIDRQRAFVSALVYAVKNQRFTNYHSIGVKRLPDGARMYEFRGQWQKNSLSIQDDHYNKIIDSQFYDNPWGVEVTWIGKRRSERIKIKIPHESTRFYGIDGEYFRFEGAYYAPSDKVEIRDSSQDTYKYVYRILW
jgi:hypothetical protein